MGFLKSHGITVVFRCVYSVRYTLSIRIIEKSPVSCVSRKAPFSELLPSLHLAGRQAQHKYPYKPVEQSVFIVIKYRVSGL